MFSKRLAYCQRVLLLLSLTVSTCFCSRLSILNAGELVEQAKSLAAIPANASFYVAWLKNAEQLASLKETKAWQKLLTIPALQMGLMQAKTWWQYPPVENLIAVKKWVESPDGQKVMTLFSEMVSEEIFIYGDHSLGELIQLAMEINSQISSASLQRLGEKGSVGAVDSKEQVKELIIELLREHHETLRVPNLVKGFRIRDRELASSLIDLLEAELKALFDQEKVPLPLQNRLKRSIVDGHDLLTYTVSEEVLPWEEIERKWSSEPELYDLLRDLLKNKQVVIAVGVVNQFVVFSLGDSIDHFQGLGEGQLLVDTPAFQKLNQHADQRVVTLGYLSENLLQAVGSSRRSMTDMGVTAKSMLALAKLDDDRQLAIEQDIDGLINDLIDYMPEPGAQAMTTFWTDRGYETFHYNWGKLYSHIDESQPLTLLDHVGVDSIGWVVGRGKKTVASYDHCVSWIQRFVGHLEAVLEPQSDASNWAEYEVIREQVLPLLSRLNKANRELLIPGLADGQAAIVFEATVVDRKWCEFMSEAQQELPLPSMALLHGVSDAPLVKQGFAEYFDVVQSLIDIAHAAEPNDVPPLQLPAPITSVGVGGKCYSYELPTEWRASKRISPNATLGESALVLSLLPELSEKLLAGSPVSVDGPAAEFDRPLAYAMHFEFAKFMDMLRPWIDYGIQLAIENANQEAASAVGMVGFVKPQVYLFFDVLKAYHSSTSVTYYEQDTWITHSELRLIDLD